MRPAERVKIIEWVSTIVSVAMLAVLLIATLSLSIAENFSGARE
jgi:hypothetical protein